MPTPVFIIERRTPRQLRFLPAISISQNGNKFSYEKPRYFDEKAKRLTEVMDVLRKAMKLKPASLKEAFHIAQSMSPKVMENVSYSAKQSTGRPPILIAK